MDFYSNINIYLVFMSFFGVFFYGVGEGKAFVSYR
jgi:hypothetical protein